MRKTTFLGACKRQARTVLREKRLCFPIFLLCAMACFALYGYAALLWQLLGAVVTDLNAQVLVGISTVLFFLPVCLLIFPVWLGIKAVVFKGLFCGRIDFDTLFLYFTHRRRYRYAVCRALRFFLGVGASLALLFLIASLGSRVSFALLSAKRDAAAVLVLSLSLFVLLLALFFFYLLRTDGFLLDAAFLCAPLLRDGQLRAISARRMKTGRGELFRLNVSFLPLFLCSLLFLGLPLFFVGPYYFSSRIALAHRLLSE